MNNTKKVCPFKLMRVHADDIDDELDDRECEKELCAWWNEDKCSILAIAERTQS